jgi:hypothetical protein
MAIQYDLQESNFGIGFNGAYYRVVTASLSRIRDNQFSVMIDLAGYAEKPAHDNIQPVDFKRFHVPLADIDAAAGDDFLSKCYDWAMQQLAGSVAV